VLARIPTEKVLKFDFSFFTTGKVLKLDIVAEKSQRSPDFLLVLSGKTKILNA